MKGQKLLTIAAYLPPRGSWGEAQTETVKKAIEWMEQLLDKAGRCCTPLIAGDFNDDWGLEAAVLAATVQDLRRASSATMQTAERERRLGYSMSS